MMSFDDAEVVKGYAERTARLVPGLRDLHRMSCLLLAERAPADARVLVLGAGGGLELKAFAEMRPGWRFDGVDPSAEMIELARKSLSLVTADIALHEGYIQDAPDGPFDAAACLLTLHFLAPDERLETVREVYRRLKPGAAFVVAHHSFPNGGADRDRWLARNGAFSVDSGMPADRVARGLEAMKEKLPVLPPEEDEDILRRAGFVDVELFYAALTFKGWVAYKPTREEGA